MRVGGSLADCSQSMFLRRIGVSVRLIVPGVARWAVLSSLLIDGVGDLDLTRIACLLGRVSRRRRPVGDCWRK